MEMYKGSKACGSAESALPMRFAEAWKIPGLSTRLPTPPGCHKAGFPAGFGSKGPPQGCCWAWTVGQHSIFISGLAIARFYIYSLKGAPNCLLTGSLQTVAWMGAHRSPFSTAHSCLTLPIALACLQARMCQWAEH